jgi:hypothetical protein
MKTMLRCCAVFAMGLVNVPQVSAFCGFYVARADTKLYNKASQVCLVREGNRTVITMDSDFHGDLKEFAMVVPVPTVIDKKDVQVVERTLLEHLDAYTAPRLVEYWDDDPCDERAYAVAEAPPSSKAVAEKHDDGAKGLGVTIEKQFSVGEYDILILSAKQSDGLVTWLKENDYRIPEGAEDVLGSYIKQGMKFFVAKINLAEKEKSGQAWLRPLRIEFDTRKFMLPIRLGTVNANGPQDLIIHTLTRKGRVETTNYRVKRLPSDVEIPEFVKKDFGHFYRDMFARVMEIENMQTVLTEYAWDLGWCDPCSSDPLPKGELRKLGVDWLQGSDEERPTEGTVFITRLHVRYDREHFPEDLVFQETGDKTNFQGRYVMRHAWHGQVTCVRAQEYLKELPKRREQEARNLASLTGWKIEDIREKQESYVEPKRKAPKE